MTTTHHQDETSACQEQGNNRHMQAARRYAPVLVARTRQLIRNGADLTEPTTFVDFVNDQVHDTITDTELPECPGSEIAAALAMVAELARLHAEATR